MAAQMRNVLLSVVFATMVLSARSASIFPVNSTWRYFKGLSEASTPDTTAWRNLGFADGTWLTGEAPFFFDDNPGSANAYTGNTELTDMFGNYSCIFMRQTFVLTNVAQIPQLQLTAWSDDGFIAWINGTEVARFNMPGGNIPYNGTSSSALGEPVPLQKIGINNPASFLHEGTNVMAIQAFNSSIGASSDFVIQAALDTLTSVAWGGVGISEFMATNVATVVDADGTNSPWIEICNPTTSAVNLNNWSLTDDVNNPTLWRFPNVTIEPASFIVVFASGKNRAVNINELHTNFRLPVNGGYLALVNSSGTTVSSFSAYPAQLPDVSYGRDMVSPNLTGFFTKPTPADPNSTSGTNFSSSVSFSRKGSTFVTSFSLQLTTANPNAIIYYTLDGSPPDSSSTVYTGPISITGSAQVRARSFAAGLMPGALRSETYLKLDSSLVNTTSDLPAIVIYNFGAGGVPQDDKQFANISLYEPTNGITSLTNGATLTARAGFEVRGSSTAGLPKQSFAVEFRDDLDNDKDYSVLGMPSESDWVLYAPNNFEPVLIHNPLVYQLSNEIGRYAPRTRFVEVYLNTTGGPVTSANYNGIYVLEEKIKWGKDRVAIDKVRSVDELHPQDNSGTNVTGGYLMKVDRLGPGESGFNAAGQTIAYVNPGEDDINTPQRAPQKQYIQTYMNAFGSALNGVNYANPTTGFRAYIEETAWLDHHILNVMSFNVDALRLSAYFYKERNGKLSFGPVWDFDRTQGSTDGRDFSPFYWRAPNGDGGTDFFNYPWWGRMFTDINFWQAWIDRYQVLRDGALSTTNIYADIDALTAQVKQQQPREVARWSSLTRPRSGTISISGYSYNFPGTYQGEINFLKKWYADRLLFMDTNLLARPVFGNNSGVITPGFTLAMTGPSGATIYYTTNGSDPRLSGGGIAPGALVYSSPISLTAAGTVRARAYNTAHHNLTGPNNPPLSSPWSGLTSEDFVAASAPVITQFPGNLEAYLGQNPTFTVQATGNPSPTYQWKFNGAKLSGETGAQLTLPSLQANQAGTYSVGVTNVAGGTSAAFVLTIAPKPNLVITEVMSNPAKNAPGVTLSTEDWWELSNFGNSAVNLQGYRFNDDHDTFAGAATITNATTIAAGESIILVSDMTPADFRAWWGTQNLSAGLQIIPYADIGFGSSGDAIYLWNAAAGVETDTITSVMFATATKGVSFGYDFASGTFGGLSVAGQNGAFVAAVNGDIGSPGIFASAPVITEFSYEDGSGFNLGFATVPNLDYRVEYKNKLTDPVWTTLTNFTASSTQFNFTDPGAKTNAARFYRVGVVP